MSARVLKLGILVWFILVCDVKSEDGNQLCKDEYHWVPEMDGTFQEKVVPTQDMNERCSKISCATKCCKPSEVLYQSNTEAGCIALSKVRNHTSNKVDNQTKFDYSELFVYEMDDDMDIIKSNYTIKDLNVRCNGKFYNDAISCTSGLNGEYEGFFMLKGKTLEDLKLATENQNRWKNPAWDKDNFCFEYLINDFEELSVNMYYLTYPKPAELTLEDYYAQKKFFEFKVSAFIISSIFLLLVLVVYGSLPQLRRLPGMVQMAYCATYATALILNAAKIIVQLQIAEMLTDREIYFNRLIYLTYVIYYLLLSSFFWMNIMSFDIWWTFRGLHKQRKIHRDGELAKFCWYALYAWGTPLLITIVAVIIDKSDLRKYNIIKPHFEDSLALTMEFNLYFNIPVGVLLLFNIYFFSLTAYTYWRIKKGLRKIQDSGTSNGKFRFEMYLKLAVVMGVGWIIEVFIDSIPKWLEYISAVYNGFIGVAIFIVFVVKRHICVKFCQRYGLQHRFKFVANLEQKWSSTKTQREDSKRSMSSCDSGIQVQMTPTMR